LPKRSLACRVCEASEERIHVGGSGWASGQVDLCTTCSGSDQDLEQVLQTIGNPRSTLSRRDVGAIARAALRRRANHLAETQRG
jgi:hypothetical protein